jgi:hypothetical protein
MIGFFRSRGGLVLIVSLVVAGYFVVREHRVHLSGYLPLALLALFILFHLLMHRTHGGHSHQADHGGDRTEDSSRGSEDGKGTRHT